MDEEEGYRLITQTPLPRVTRNLAASLTAPILWYVREGLRSEIEPLHHASTFFLRIDDAGFGVTADHVINQLLEDQRTHSSLRVQIGGLRRQVRIT